MSEFLQKLMAAGREVAAKAAGKPYEPGWKSDAQIVAEELCCAGTCLSRGECEAELDQAERVVARLRANKRLLTTPERAR